MNITKIPPPTDEEILSSNRVPVLTAAKYLGMTYPMLAYKLQQGEMPFGVARNNNGTWSYNINPQMLYDYKHKVSEVDVIKKILAQQKEQIEMLTLIVEKLGQTV